ncbi:OmpA family protein [Vibrio owensii]|uniref:OmpA family protein n=1 Tax=Vibrio owensii TaxID=696485 RepID=UPI003CC51770
MKKMILLAVIASISLSGCQLTRQNAYTGEEEVSSMSKGVLGGCAAGAIAGGLLKKGKGAAIGCLLAGTAGGVYGAQLDEQEAKLRHELKNTGVQVYRQDDHISLIMSNDIVFTTGSASLSHTIKPALRSVAKVLKEFDNSRLVVRGHTDSRGKAAYNQTLSETRASNVASYLKAYGINSSRIETLGLGEMAPRCSNETLEGQRCNRRVELMMYPAG